MSFQEQLVDEINELRTTPQSYAKKVKKYVRYFAQNILKIPGSKAGIRTEEGAAAYEEAADYLLNFKDDLKPLEPSKGLGRICEEFLDKAKAVDPEDIGTINIKSIIENYGSFSGSLNRAIDFGGEDPEQVVMNLLVCDGDPNRSNRDSLLSSEFNKIGVAFSKHDTYGYCTLIITCTKFKNTYDSDDYGFIESQQEFSPQKPAPKKKPPEPKKQPEPYKRQPEPKKQEEPYKRQPEPYKRAPEPKKQEEPYKRQPESYKRAPEPKKQEEPYKRQPESYRRAPEPKKPTESYRKKPPVVEQADDEEEDDIPPEGVVSETKTERIIMERGKKKRVIKIVRIMEDGSKETETIKENVDDD